MLAIIATVGWIIFDVAISLATVGDTMMPAWEWWAFLCGGVALGVAALVGEIMDRRAHANEIAKLLAGNQAHSQEHDVLAKGNIAVLDRLATLTQTTGQSENKIIFAATETINRLSGEVATIRAELTARYWQKPTEAQTHALIHAFKNLGPHTVALIPDPNTDCSELARSFVAIFKSAGWQAGSLYPANRAVRGMFVAGKANSELAHKVAAILFDIMHCLAPSFVERSPDEQIDLEIGIGPKVHTLQQK